MSSPQYPQQPGPGNQNPQAGPPNAPQYGGGVQYGSAPAAPDRFVPAGGSYPQTHPVAPQGGVGSKNIWGVLALVAGIIGVLGSFVFGLGFLPALLAVIFGFVGLSAVKKGLANNNGLNITGLILGFIGLLLSIVMGIMAFLGFGLLAVILDEASTGSYSSSSGSDGGDPGSATGSDPVLGESYTGYVRGDGATPARVTGAADEATLIAPDVEMYLDVVPGVAGDTVASADHTQGEIALVVFTIVNDGAQEIDLGQSRMSLWTPEGVLYPSVIDTGKYEGDTVFGPIAAGAEQTSEVAFAVPIDEVYSSVAQFDLVSDLGYGDSFSWSGE